MATRERSGQGTPLEVHDATPASGRARATARFSAADRFWTGLRGSILRSVGYPLLETALIGFFMFVMTMVILLFGLMAGARWLRLDRRYSEPRPSVSPGQVERLESAIMLLESRLDEMQEQQKFLERLLAERPESRQLGPGEAGDPGPTGGGQPDQVARRDDTGSILLDGHIRSREDEP